MYKRTAGQKDRKIQDISEDNRILKEKSFNKVTFSRPIMSNRVIADRLNKERNNLIKESNPETIVSMNTLSSMRNESLSGIGNKRIQKGKVFRKKSSCPDFNILRIKRINANINKHKIKFSLPKINKKDTKLVIPKTQNGWFTNKRVGIKINPRKRLEDEELENDIMQFKAKYKNIIDTD
mmetsp:Transcript_28068/g.24797  ORF Transcript_28068/g.24797 Transcript_28068/m.24797 type:complete len:180 (-) Transcript_28068:8-547(-)